MAADRAVSDSVTEAAKVSFFKRPIFRFVSGRAGPFKEPVTLDRRRIYILPTRNGLVFSVFLLFLLVGSVNYDKSLGFVLTFLLVGIGNIGLLLTWKNLAGIRLSTAGAQPVFAGEDAVFNISLESTDENDKYSIILSHAGNDQDQSDIVAGRVQIVQLRMKTQQRGQLDPGQFKLYTEFPLGLFVAWTVIDLSMRCTIYPTPAASAVPERDGETQDGEVDDRGDGNEEFSGLKRYQHGDSWRRISWKALARSGQVFIKEFHGGEPITIWIDFDRMQAKDTETRLSMMTRLIIDAEEQGCLYGLRLGNQVVEPDQGRHHQHDCLRRLATYGLR